MQDYNEKLPCIERIILLAVVSLFKVRHNSNDRRLDGRKDSLVVQYIGETFMQFFDKQAFIYWKAEWYTLKLYCHTEKRNKHGTPHATLCRVGGATCLVRGISDLSHTFFYASSTGAFSALIATSPWRNVIVMAIDMQRQNYRKFCRYMLTRVPPCWNCRF